MALINVVSLAIASLNSFFFTHVLQKAHSLFTDSDGATMSHGEKARHVGPEKTAISTISVS